MKILILAGGFATRLWPLTEKKAKPLLPIAGKPIISHLVDLIPDEHEIIVCTNQVFEDDFLEWAKLYPHKNIDVFIEDSGSDDGKKGALGATSLVIQEKNIQEDLMLLAGDNIFGFGFEDFVSKYQGNPIVAVYDVQDLNEAKKYGVVVTDENKVIEFQEKPQEPKSTLVSTGCYIFPKETLKDIDFYAQDNADDLGGIFEYFMQQGKQVDYFSFDQYWFDIGSFQGYISAHVDLHGKVRGRDEVRGMGYEEKKSIPHTSYFVPNNQTEKYEQQGTRNKEKPPIPHTSYLVPNNQLHGAVYLGKNVTLKNSTIENSLILDNVTLENCCIRNCIVDRGSVIKNIDLQWKILREQTNIEG